MNAILQRLVLVAALAAALAVALGGCGGDDDDGDTGAAPAQTEGSETSLEDLHIAYASASDAIGIFKVVGDNIVTDAEKLGMKATRYDNNLDPQTAIRNADLMIQEKPDIIIDWNAIVSAAPAIGKKVERAGIPCLSVNQQIPGCHWFNLSNKQMGTDAADVLIPMAKERGWDASNTTVFMVIAAANGTEVNDGPRHFYISIAEQLDGFTKVTPEDITPQTTVIGDYHGLQIDGKSSIEDAYTAAKNVIQTIPQGNNILLYGSDSDLSLGAFRALKEAGRDKQTLTCGLGATPEGLTQLRTNPQWMCEGALFLEDWPRYIIAEAVAILRGETPPDLTPAPQVMLTKDTVDTYYEGNKVKLLPPLAPEAEYLKETGVLERLGPPDIEGLND
jgi:ribose transport system substrate-binding protein